CFLSALYGGFANSKGCCESVRRRLSDKQRGRGEMVMARSQDQFSRECVKTRVRTRSGSDGILTVPRNLMIRSLPLAVLTRVLNAWAREMLFLAACESGWAWR